MARDFDLKAIRNARKCKLEVWVTNVIIGMLVLFNGLSGSYCCSCTKKNCGTGTL